MVGFKRFNSQIFACGFLLLLNFNEIFGDTSADSWFMFARETTKVLKTCYQSVCENCYQILWIFWCLNLS